MPRHPKPDQPWRPQLRLPAATLSRLQARPLDDVAAMLAWAETHWPGRVNAAQPQGDAQAVTLRPERPRELVPADLWHDAPGGRLVVGRPVISRAFHDDLAQVGPAFRWVESRGQYERTLTARVGAPDDRVAELAAQLYLRGWAVRLPSQDLARRVVRGGYTREQHRWLDVLTDGRFLLTWEYGGDAVYAATKLLPHARWDKARQGTVVPRVAAPDVWDFTREWHFAVTDAAQGALLAAEAELARDLIGVQVVVPPAPHEQPRAALPGPGGVIPDDLLAD